MADTLSQALLEASLLSSLSEEDEGSVVIDVDRRTMVLPTGFFFGVYNDKDILKVPFVIPRYYNELDLSDFQITVNYINSAGYGNIYRVTDAEVTESAIRFKWVTGRGVFVKEGTVRFIVCLRQIGTGGEVEKEFNTTIASANVLKGLEVDENPDPVAYSILAHMEELKDQADAAVEVVEGAADRIDDAVSEAEQAIAAMYHSPYVAPTAADMLSHDKVYVYTGNETGYTFGNWYYWNGSEFVSGGVYNATAFETDDTLSINGAAADAKKTGDEIAELKEVLSGQVIFATLSSSNLENGALNSDGINAGSMTYRVRTTGYIELPQSDSVYISVTSDKDISFCAVQYAVNDFTTPKLKYGSLQKPGRVDLVDGAKYLRLVFSVNQTTENISPSDIESVDFSVVKASVVKFTTQTLTDAEKAQARKNIGAMSDNDGWISNFVVSNGYLCQKVEVI